jgi:lipopolysaccharide biosynthesis protein
LQSYFLLFHKAAINAPFFANRWQNYVHVQSKSWVIRKHEVGLTPEIHKAGLRTRALYRYRDLLNDFVEKVGDASVLDDKSLSPSHRNTLGQIFNHAENGMPLNSSHFFWDQLILGGYPFIKREVLQGNPMGLPSLYRWEALVRENTKYDTELINEHLEYVMRGRFI